MRFYLLEAPKPGSIEDRAGRVDFSEAGNPNRGPAPTCPRCGRFLGMLTWLPPYRVEIKPWGRHWGDVARMGNDLIVSERFRKAFVEESLKGIEKFDPVEVVKVDRRWGKPKEPMPRYFKATVARNSATIDYNASGYEWRDESQICPECIYGSLNPNLKRYKRLVVKQETWNGDDVFFPRGAARVMVSERFRSMFHDHKLLGAVFIPSESEDAGYDLFPWETAPNQG
ncbi:MAG: hypothetical protein GYA36_20390 [Veillonellaceae bacterium]|nr:hypothetical protein [Veillonellaceae bacterium]